MFALLSLVVATQGCFLFYSDEERYNARVAETDSLAGNLCFLWDVHRANEIDYQLIDQELDDFWAEVKKSGLDWNRHGEQGELVLAMPSGSEVRTRIAHLASLGGRSVVSIRNELGNWNVFALELDGAGTTLTVRAPNLEALESAMTSGTLTAARPEFFFDGDEIEIRASAEELAAYFAAHPEVFDVVAAILTRRPPGG